MAILEKLLGVWVEQQSLGLCSIEINALSLAPSGFISVVICAMRGRRSHVIGCKILKRCAFLFGYPLEICNFY
jgi:hypothetical protein